MLAVVEQSCDLLLGKLSQLDDPIPQIQIHFHQDCEDRRHEHRSLSFETLRSADVVTPIEPPIEGHQPRNYEGFINPIPEILETTGQILLRIAALNHQPREILSPYAGI